MEKNKLGKTGISEWLRDKWAHNPMFSTLLALLVMVLVQSVVMTNLAGSFSGMFGKMGMAWLNILRNNTYAGIIGLGMCFIIISGGIDLSVGSMLCALGAMLMYLLDEGNGPLAAMGLTGAPAYAVAIVLIMLAGVIMGLMNGALIAYGKLPPFIATLGTMKIFRSVTQQLTKTFNPTVPQGFKAMVPAITILTLATALKNISNDILGSASYVEKLMQSEFAQSLANFLPAVIFVVACILSSRRPHWAVRPSPSAPMKRQPSSPVSMSARSSARSMPCPV